MAWPDLSDLRTEIRTSLRVLAGTRKLSDTVLNRFINDAQRETAIEALCIEDEVAAVTTPASRLVSFSPYYAVKRVDYVPNEASEQIVALQKISLNQLGRMPYYGDFPQYYTLWGSYVLIDPVSALVYDLLLHIAKAPTSELSADTDEPQISKSLIQAINPAAAYRYHLRFRQWQNMQVSYNEYVAITRAGRNMYIDKADESETSFMTPDIVEMGG